ncbi:hypothetical protein METBIDRAFT_31347 [Metschnikowia bicuspidata var. bicuspidata NRRL YB-4993]|uniref:GOLD domain-containing protein n=1 Tax=Metschnikowia bicuspidata var. bicuspidata NRRL YB-4993 TaxID=869754 RepID=A0A1A0HEB6_9ASCO|nr:hypothetical protein METBIDRAFT_31347 [Metschnikowia bicuspidata var. bicuspidata NRRL YB-4993]OBA22454.1 hypothetical protein METBIDRAFT_31347 [Metschnikowia bicuspidata var. bicuspidata NRRL YB-4993]
MFANTWVLLSCLLLLAAALQLDVPALDSARPVCIRDFVGKDQLVVISVNTDGYRGDGQKLQLTVIDTLGNQFARKNDINKETRISFTTHESAAIDICFANFLDRGHGGRRQLSREVNLEVESGASARDWNALQTAEKLKPAEVDLRRVHEMTKEIAQELHYLKGREERMRDTNESTNARVQWFSILIILVLLALGAWQIQYLRHYFKVKHII